MKLKDGSFGHLLNSALFVEERIFKLSSAVLGKTGRLTITLLVQADHYDNLLTKELTDKVKQIIKGLLPDGVPHVVAFEKTFTSETYIQHLIEDFFIENLPLAYAQLADVDVDIVLSPSTVVVKLALAPHLYSFLQSSQQAEKMETFLDAKLMEDVTVRIQNDQTKKREAKAASKRRTRLPKSDRIRLVEIDNVQKVFGLISRTPRPIGDVNQKEQEKQAIVGKVSRLQQRNAKKDNKPFFTFSISDDTATMKVAFFPRKRHGKHAMEDFSEHVKDGVTLAVEGAISFSDYSNQFELICDSAALCTILETTTEAEEEVVEEELLPIPTEYAFVTPTPFHEEVQGTIFELTNERVLPDKYKDTFVVFDLETMGLNPETDGIIEIGACKVVNGAITEIFSSFINAENRLVPPHIESLTGICDQDLADAPYWLDVVGDFALFCDQTTLVGHNIDEFDMKMLHHHAKGSGYRFLHKTIDTLKLSRKLVKGLRAYNLGAMLKQFGITNPHAHRAVYDAVANAKLFLELGYLDTDETSTDQAEES